MRRTEKPDPPADEPLLFDLPMTGDEEAAAETAPEDPRPMRGSRRGAAAEPPAARPGPMPVPPPPLPPEPLPRPASEYASRGSRFAAGLADLVAHAAVGVVALLGVRWLGVRPELSDGPALAVFLLTFSFLYTVLPLAFWGHTLGMAWTGITSRNRDGEPLTFDQTARRWLGGLLTVLTLGVPLLVTGARRSLTDLLSGSVTYPDEEA